MEYKVLSKAKTSASAATAKRRAERPNRSISEHHEQIAAWKGIAEIIYQAQKDKGALGKTQKEYGLMRYYFNKFPPVVIYRHKKRKAPGTAFGGGGMGRQCSETLSH